MIYNRTNVSHERDFLDTPGRTVRGDHTYYDPIVLPSLTVPTTSDHQSSGVPVKVTSRVDTITTDPERDHYHEGVYLTQTCPQVPPLHPFPCRLLCKPKPVLETMSVRILSSPTQRKNYETIKIPQL